MSAVPEVSMLQGLFSGFAAHLGLNLREYQQAQTVIAVTVQPHHLNQAGNLHGGVIALSLIHI